MDSWGRFDEILLPNKEVFYSNLNKDDITDVDYRHAKKVFNNFTIKSFCNHHDLHDQSDTLLLAGMFESFRNKCIEIYEFDPAYFLSAAELEWQTGLKKQE